MKEVSGSELAALTGRTWRTIKALFEQAGVRPKRREGRSDLYDSETALRSIYQPTTGGDDYDDQRQRLAAAQSEKVEMDNAVRRGELATRADVVRFWSDCQSAARAKFLGIGSKLSPQLVNIGDASIIAAAIRSEVIAALAEFADYEPSESVRVVERDQVEPAAAAEPDRQPVGRPRKKTQQRKQRRARAVAD